MYVLKKGDARWKPSEVLLGSNRYYICINEFNRIRSAGKDLVLQLLFSTQNVTVLLISIRYSNNEEVYSTYQYEYCTLQDGFLRYRSPIQAVNRFTARVTIFCWIRTTAWALSTNFPIQPRWIRIIGRVSLLTTMWSCRTVTVCWIIQLVVEWVVKITTTTATTHSCTGSSWRQWQPPWQWSRFDTFPRVVGSNNNTRALKR